MAGTGQCHIHAITFSTLEVIASQQSIRFQMADIGVGVWLCGKYVETG